MFFFFGQLSGMIKHIVSVDLMWKQNEDIYHCNTSVIIEASWAGAWNYLSQLFNIALLHQFSFLVWMTLVILVKCVLYLCIIAKHVMKKNFLNV